MNLLFQILVLIGFVAMAISTFAGSPWAQRVAWCSWTVACVLWMMSGQ
jgi:hypothetical protein